MMKQTLVYPLMLSALLMASSVSAGELHDPELIKQGEYLARAGDCVACHTAKNGKPFAGGLSIATPVGTIYATNITPDPATGIGSYSLDDFDKAVRHGLAKDGYALYPAMPFPSYAKVSADDVRAMYAYFMNGVEPVQQRNRPSEIPWPLSMRWPLQIWRYMYAPEVAKITPKPVPIENAQIARGAYLVQGLGHCGSCHTPRALTLQEKALDESDPDYLAGGQVIDGWVAISLRGNQFDGLGSWSEDDIVQTLRTGRNEHSASLGPMNDVIEHSGQFMNDSDLHAIAKYLKSLPASNVSEDVSFKREDSTAKALYAGESPSRGAELYVDNCAACHRTDGQGYKEVFPRLAGNPSILSGDASSMIRLILSGSKLPSTEQAPSNLTMPDFAWRLNDQEAAQLVNFIRNSWGNRAPTVKASEVSEVRKNIQQEHQGEMVSHEQENSKH